MPRLLRTLCLVAFPLLAWNACTGDGKEGTASLDATDPNLESCILCSMVVREQPAPRAQVVHRNGFRAFLCAVSELEPYLAAPSEHGRPGAVYVEVLSADDFGNEVSIEPHTWTEGADAFFVVDGPRRPVMGTPVLSYGRKEEAAKAAAEVRGRVVDWAGLLEFLES